ncbi:MAG TPA: V-type ATPase subunit [Candidatus Blautia gallistercoris]|uniref:V-type ATPase subunit n=1 Tax=Candidatus Blautia gallistercoris TaxID=2838490 RepID=A0A9D1WJJ0_9FIRM|nr:V-type ATPase subunit [Candidatus Blautia gallistercoris]
MGNILSYSGLSTKIRAMSSKLTTPEQFEEIAQLESVPQVVAYLKKCPEYRKIWADLDESSLHRGQVERLLQKSIFQDFTKIYYFANREQRKFLDLYSARYEIRAIKECLRTIFDRRDIELDISQYREFFRRHSRLDVDQLQTCTTLDELIQATQRSELYIPLSRVHGSEHSTLFDYGMALDLHYFNHIWKIKDKMFKGKDLQQINKAYGSKFDLLNLEWIYRSKRFYNMDSADIYALLIPVEYKLKKKEINAMVEASSIEEFQQILDGTYYGTRFKTMPLPQLEEFYTYLLRTILEKESSRNPHSVAMIYSFLYHKEHEVRRLTIAIECIRYGVSYEETMNYIRKN